ncbi:MAG: nucleotide sugar dehydrogenase [Candidatus Nanopelagicaceae bacterium]|nr:nucleotide sugar dehydrogenase [Candidatus Nanopelagicaceae bacterium]
MNNQTETKGTVVIVGGGGHVGLPLGLALARSGYNLIAYDTSVSTVEQINSGVVPFIEDGAEELLKSSLTAKRFRASIDPKCLVDADIIIVVIGTPVDEHLSPDPNSVVNAVKELLPYLNSSQLLILRSTVFPGVSQRVEGLINEEVPGMDMAYCPERIAEGHALKELATLPQVIGVRNDSAFTRAAELFNALSGKTLRTTPEEAELAKLFTNVWRYLKFAAANQFFMMANDFGVDYEKVRHAIAHEYPRASDLPMAGFAAGPCLFKDTMQLSALVQQNFPLGHAAMMINEGTPGYLVSRLERRFDLSKMTVGILGMAFKADVDDTRSSLAYKLRKLLLFKCKEVLIADPYVRDERLVSQDTLLKCSDLLVIGAPHGVYKHLQTDTEIIDIWGLRSNGVLI